jgi:hypothetical protein
MVYRKRLLPVRRTYVRCARILKYIIQHRVPCTRSCVPTYNILERSLKFITVVSNELFMKTVRCLYTHDTLAAAAIHYCGIKPPPGRLVD